VNDSLRLALPNGQTLGPVLECFKLAGLELPSLSSKVVRINNPFDTGFDLELFATSAADVCRYVETGVCHAGIAGTEILCETEVEVWRPFTFNIESYPIVFAGRKGQSFESLQSKPNLRLTTPFPNFVNDWFSRRGLSVEVIAVSEGSEIAVELSMADGYVDLLTCAETLVARDFRVLDVLGHTRLKLIVNRALASKRRETLGKLIELFQNNRPPEPPPISIPFDLDDP